MAAYLELGEVERHRVDRWVAAALAKPALAKRDLDRWRQARHLDRLFAPRYSSS